MIERLYLKDHFTFKEVELGFKNGLVVFTGPSGAGKSVLMGAVLALFGLSSPAATLSEIVLDLPVDVADFGIEPDDLAVIRQIKKEKMRYFLNNQAISKRRLEELCSRFVKHLGQKEAGEFENRNLLLILDSIAAKADREYEGLLSRFRSAFLESRKLQSALKKIEEEERRIEDLREFARFEIAKINEVDPKEGEDEELMEIKKQLSRKERILEAISRGEKIFDYEHQVVLALEMLEANSAFFDDAMNELRAMFEEARTGLARLEEVDVEGVLDRIEKLSELKRRYGSIKEALKYRAKKEKELEYYDNIAFEKDHIQKKLSTLGAELERDSNLISKKRIEAARILEGRLNYYLALLSLPPATVSIEPQILGESGQDHVVLRMGSTLWQNVSAGEFNRLRLALLAAQSEYDRLREQILIVDEIDANLSGEESMRVARVLKVLAKSYQIFAISHQPQLTSQADQHFLVTKEDNQSLVRELSEEERILEIARMVSAETITAEAIGFAKNILEVPLSEEAEG